MVYLDIKSMSKFSSQTLHDIFSTPSPSHPNPRFLLFPQNSPWDLKEKNLFSGPTWVCANQHTFFHPALWPTPPPSCQGQEGGGVGIFLKALAGPS